MTFVCLWAPAWPTAGAAAADPPAAAAPGRAPLAPRDAAWVDTPPGTPLEAPSLSAATSLPCDLLCVAPHVTWGARGVLWLDARGLGARWVAERALEVARAHGATGVRAGVAAAAVAAEVAALHAGADVTVVPSGRERGFLAPFAVGVLAPTPRMAAALADVGIERCGDLAGLTREAVETRLGPEGSALWRLARGDDPRLVFAPRPRALPCASLAWEEYALRDPERLLFPANALITTVCAELRARGEAARQMTLTLALADGSRTSRPLRAARITADRAVWLRLVQQELERFTLSEGVVGLAVRAEAAAAAEAPQGDLFDRGFQSAEAAAAALARLIDDGDAVLLGLIATAHPLVERRAEWAPRPVGEALGWGAGARPGMAPRRVGAAPGGRGPLPETEVALAARGAPPETHDRSPAPLGRHRFAAGPPIMPPPPPDAALSLQLLPAPKPVAVTTTVRRGLRVPTRYHDDSVAAPRLPGDAELLAAVGPDIVSGGREVGEPYAREYFQCLTGSGTLVLLFRDLRAAPPHGPRGGAWYLHGWWD